MTNYNCKTCKYSTINKVNFKKHLLTNKHILQQSQDHKPKITSSTIELENVEEYKCDHCDQTFTKKNNLYRHRKKFCKKKTNDEHNDKKSSESQELITDSEKYDELQNQYIQLQEYCIELMNKYTKLQNMVSKYQDIIINSRKTHNNQPSGNVIRINVLPCNK